MEYQTGYFYCRSLIELKNGSVPFALQLIKSLQVHFLDSSHLRCIVQLYLHYQKFPKDHPGRGGREIAARIWQRVAYSNKLDN